MWRLLIGLGCVPGVIALYFRLTIPETPRFTMDIERNIDQASHDIKAVTEDGIHRAVDPDEMIQRIEAPKATWSDFIAHFGKWQNFKILLGTAWSWFALDVGQPRSVRLHWADLNLFLRLPFTASVLTPVSFCRLSASALHPTPTPFPESTPT